MRTKIHRITKNRIINTLLVCSLIICLSSDSTIAGEAEFLKKLFDPVRFSWSFKLYPLMSDDDKRNLMEAKETLAEFLKSVISNPFDYMTPELKKKYKDRIDFYMKEFDGAEVIVEMEIYDFKLTKKASNIIEFYVSVTNFTEGDESSSEYFFTFKDIQEDWVISELARIKDPLHRGATH